LFENPLFLTILDHKRQPSTSTQTSIRQPPTTMYTITHTADFDRPAVIPPGIDHDLIDQILGKYPTPITVAIH
jgi:hypothetical protein